jgi:hypothetical protein
MGADPMPVQCELSGIPVCHPRTENGRSCHP